MVDKRCALEPLGLLTLPRMIYFLASAFMYGKGREPRAILDYFPLSLRTCRFAPATHLLRSKVLRKRSDKVGDVHTPEPSRHLSLEDKSICGDRTRLWVAGWARPSSPHMLAVG